MSDTPTKTRPPSMERVVAALAQDFDVPVEEFSMFRSRVVAMRRVGFHEEFKQGQGKASGLPPEETLELSIAMRLNLCGFGRERTIEIVESNRNRIQTTTHNPFILAVPQVFGGGEIAISVSVPDRVLSEAIDARGPTGQSLQSLRDDMGRLRIKDAMEALLGERS